MAIRQMTLYRLLAKMYLPDNLLLCASFILCMLGTGLLHDVWELSLSPLHVVAYHDNDVIPPNKK
jgi:hypothetical protein